ncbi:MAG: hypothetical protein K0S39_3418 [Paenibacillus sp.]|jgi:hypothetical protein|nr:hypothetical protein [Paenibacillus sp.]
MRIKFEDKEIPVTFLSSDHKMIPRLIQALKTHTTLERQEPSPSFDLEQLERIEVIGTEAYLYSKDGPNSGKVYLALHGG